VAKAGPLQHPVKSGLADHITGAAGVPQKSDTGASGRHFSPGHERPRAPRQIALLFNNLIRSGEHCAVGAPQGGD
jgi:hypothetical protein